MSDSGTPTTLLDRSDELIGEEATTHIARTEAVYACGESRDSRMPLVRIRGGLQLVTCQPCRHQWLSEGGW